MPIPIDGERGLSARLPIRNRSQPCESARSQAVEPCSRYNMPTMHSRWEIIQKQSIRGAVKAGLDFVCGVLAVLLGLASAHRLDASSAIASLMLALLVGTVVSAGNAAGLSYRTTWRYSNVKEQLVLTLTSCAVFLVLVTLGALRIVALPMSTVLLVPLLTFALSTGARTLRRWQLAYTRRRRSVARQAEQASRAAQGHRILVVGAGHAGFMISRQLEESRDGTVDIVGFLDDDQTKIGTLLNGIPVLGRVDQMMTIAERFGATEIVVAMPSAPLEFVRTLMRRAEDVGLRARTFSGMGRLLVDGENHRPGTITMRELRTQTPTEWPAVSPANGDRRVLVTGGAGFIGSHLTRMLLDRGYHVRILENFTYGDAGLAGIRQHPRLEIVQGDICSLRDVGRAMRDVEGVIALAAIVGDPACNLDPEETINLNYSSTKILAEAADFYRVGRLVFASSCSVYGASAREDDLLNERSRLNPVSLYARTRVLSENIVFDRCGDTEPVVLRLATVFGLSPRMRFDLVVNTLTARAVIDKRISIFGGRQWRPNVHCRDAARAFLTALEAPSDRVAGEVFNVGGDENNHRISDIGDIVANLVGNVQINLQNEIPDPRDYRVSFEKIRRVLGFEPKYLVADGVNEVASAMQSDLSLRTHMDPLFHNVHALRMRERPAPGRALASA